MEKMELRDFQADKVDTQTFPFLSNWLTHSIILALFHTMPYG